MSKKTLPIEFANEDDLVINNLKHTNLPNPKFPLLTKEQVREIEDLVLKAWETRANTLDYKRKSKTTLKLQAEFLLGMVAVTDILTDAFKTGDSSISPKVWIGIMRGEYIKRDNEIEIEKFAKSIKK